MILTNQDQRYIPFPKTGLIILKTGFIRKMEWPRRFRHVRRDSIAIGPHPRRADASLRLSAALLSERHLSLITGQPEENIRQILLIWKDSALPQGPKRHGPAAQSRRPCSAQWPPRSGPRFPNPGCPTIWASSPDAPLEECELVVRYLDEELNQQAPETLLCLEFVIRYLRDWGETHADAAFKKARSTRRWSLIVQSQCLFLNSQMQMAVS